MAIKTMASGLARIAWACTMNSSKTVAINAPIARGLSRVSNRSIWRVLRRLSRVNHPATRGTTTNRPTAVSIVSQGTNRSGRSRRALYVTYNASSEGDLRSEYYDHKKQALAEGRVSLINHFLGEDVS